MVFVGVMCTEAEIDQRSGANVSASYDAVMKTAAALTAEATVNCVLRYDASTNWATLTLVAKPLLTDVVASMIAIQAIMYDTSGYSELNEAEDMLNILRDVVMRGLSIMKKMPVKTFLGIP